MQLIHGQLPFKATAFVAAQPSTTRFMPRTKASASSPRSVRNSASGDEHHRGRESTKPFTLALVAALLVMGLIAVTCIDVIGRYLLNRRFGSAYELTQMLLASLVFVALPADHRRGRPCRG
ncbi:hypothetical protein U0C82_08510 [Fulvimarina sp. 2208YS6-2-32]|uniref:Uncharacterized protein n=1 Tax=Fulvimarina uroteuthidis TaxID=3098149 RepID=A0ABU5I1C7_9HYPH|nr:TRAP transporter small permease subunit [Fulvimarina sp. 2208YS6-2-32]MDY8109184.1 hypothetical protein [Fulvimarina sp. 2208YS6-2-32]